MSERPKKHAWILVALFVVVGLLGAYVGGYFLLSTRTGLPFGIEREFSSKAFVTAYAPAGKMEAKLSGETVMLSWYDDAAPFLNHLIQFDP